MEYTKEKQLAVMLLSMAKADGKVTEDEITKMKELATTYKDFDSSLVLEAIEQERKEPSEVKNVMKTVDNNDKSKLIYAGANMMMADGTISFDEVCLLHEIAQIMGIPAAMVSFYLAKAMLEYPNIKFED